MSGAVREVRAEDLEELLDLYTHLHETGIPADGRERENLWKRRLADPNYHILVAERDGRLCASCTLVVIENLTRNLRPYALVENVVTRREYRRQGLASACLNRARELAQACRCYKIMLLTGAKDEDTLRFYERAGYRRNEKTAFLQRLEEAGGGAP